MTKNGKQSRLRHLISSPFKFMRVSEPDLRGALRIASGYRIFSVTMTTANPDEHGEWVVDVLLVKDVRC